MNCSFIHFWAQDSWHNLEHVADAAIEQFEKCKKNCEKSYESLVKGYTNLTHEVKKFRETHAQTIDILQDVAIKVTKVAIGTTLALSMSSVFFIGTLYGYFDKQGSRAIIKDITEDFIKAPFVAKIAILGFSALAWPGTVAVGAFLMGAHTAHALQDWDRA